MPRHLSKFLVMVGCPSDVEEEREAVHDAILQWNRAHSKASSVEFESTDWTALRPRQGADGQQVVNDTILSEADLLIVIIWSKLGTPHGPHESGTVEEFRRFIRRSSTLVYFCGRPVPAEIVSDTAAVRRFRESISREGLHSEFQSIAELKGAIINHLTSWVEDRRGDHGPTQQPPRETIGLYPADTLELPLDTWNSEGVGGTLLLYNPDLSAFATGDRFAAAWGRLASCGNIEAVCLVLTDHRVRRLRSLLGAIKANAACLPLLDRFRVIKVEGPSTTPIRAAAFRFEVGPRAGLLHPTALVQVLAPPFSRRSDGGLEGVGAAWESRLALVSHDRGLFLDAIASLCPERRQGSGSPLTELPETIDHVSPEAAAAAPQPRDDVEPRLDAASEIRRHLFDPNVPSYVLDAHYNLLDWNPAFEVVFPTDRFSRGQFVTEFLKVLANSDEVIANGRQFLNQPPLFHREQFVFDSPEFGEMKFTKITSPAPGQLAGEWIGWNVVLNIDSVERRREFDIAVERATSIAAQVAEYSVAYDLVTRVFDEYHALADAHCDWIDGSTNIVDLGCGPGHVAQRLLSRTKGRKPSVHVTAVDSSDAMLRRLRINCPEFRMSNRFHVVKANIERLRLCGTDSKAGAGELRMFDGAIMLNVLYSLHDPLQCLRRLAQHMTPGGRLALSGPRPDAEVAILLGRLNECLEQSGFDDPAIRDAVRVFSDVNRRMQRMGILHHQSIDYVRSLLDQAGFEVHDVVERIYAGQGMMIRARRRDGGPAGGEGGAYRAGTP